MFDLGWDEMALIAVVALVVLGPKELPNALRTVSGLMKQARKLAGEFQSGVHEIIREAELEDAKKVIADLNKGSIAGAIEKHLDSDGEIKSALQKPTDEVANPAAITETVAVTDTAGQEKLAAPSVDDVNPAVAAFAPGGSAHHLPEIEAANEPAEVSEVPALEGDVTATPIETGPIETGPDDALREAALSSLKSPEPTDWGSKLAGSEVSDKTTAETEKSKIS